MMKRRNFLKKAGTLTASLPLMSSLIKDDILQREGLRKITILHTNDVHSHIEPFPSNHKKYPDMGGVARRSSVIDAIRKNDPNTLLLDAGDSFQGTPYFNFYGGELEFKLMSKMGYHASTIGNHEFDEGVDNITQQMQHADFDMINANYDLSQTSLSEKVRPHKIYEMNGIKVGVFGLGIELDGLVSKKLYQDTKYLDPVAVAREQVKQLKQQKKCDLIICLSHLGFDYSSDKISDRKLAGLTQDIDLIIGGHTHTFLDRPVMEKNAEGKDVMINQVGWAGIDLGKIDFYLDKDQQKRSSASMIRLNRSLSKMNC